MMVQHCLFLSVAMCLLQMHEAGDPPPKHTNIVLIGATGDLATRYLWHGIFNLFEKNYKKDHHHFNIYACSRRDPDDGRQLLSQILLNVVKCHDDSCREMKKDFIQATSFNQLKKDEHYEKLGKKIQDNTVSQYGLTEGHISYEDGRIVYLSIPPSSYRRVTQLVHQHLRPNIGRPWFRVVLEKPFGKDLESAQLLSTHLSKLYTEQELYLIDHYLGKPIVKLIFPFRYLNRDQYEGIWNRHHIERVEIVLKEKVDVKGRFNMYDGVGVVRDVMQNHMTELLSLTAMDLPVGSGNVSAILRSKQTLLLQVAPLHPSTTLSGQYSDYRSEASTELKDDAKVQSNTPTFAAAVLNVRSSRWADIPFVFISGKKLNQKDSFVRIVFKRNSFCIDHMRNECLKQSQIVFQISSGDLQKPAMILVSKSLPKPKSFPSWRFEDIRSNVTIFGEALMDMYQVFPEVDDDAYTTLISAVYEGGRHLFIDTDSLLTSWKIWTPTVTAMEKMQPRFYEGGDVDMTRLDFILNNGALEFTKKDGIVITPPMDHPTFSHIPSSFQESPLVTGDFNAVIEGLTASIYENAIKAIQERGVFHMALPGGKSPQKLFHHLAVHTSSFPWSQTHIWLTDERCTGFDDAGSNFGQLNALLLSEIIIPHWHVHPMPVSVAGEVCAGPADILYSEMITQYTNATLDYIVLGVGADGHTASLFPNQTLTKRDSLVAFTDTGRKADAYAKRLSLTFQAINNARSVAVLVTGYEKHSILLKISDSDVDNVVMYPVMGVSPINGNFTWFIDHDALLGNKM